MSIFDYCDKKDCTSYDEGFDRYCSASIGFLCGVVDSVTGLPKPFKACDKDMTFYIKKGGEKSPIDLGRIILGSKVAELIRTGELDISNIVTLTDEEKRVLWGGKDEGLVR